MDMPFTYNKDGTEEWVDELPTGKDSAERSDVPPAVREQAEKQVEQGMEVAEIVASTRAKLEKMEKAVGRTETFAKWMDKYRLEWAASTFVPALGDFGASGIGLYVVAEALNAGVPKSVISKMLVNLAIDAVGGVIPLIGDFFDFFYHANIKNAKLFREYFEKEKAKAGIKKGAP